MRLKAMRPYNPFCDFCATQALMRNVIEDRTDNYNKRQHVKRANPGYGVIIHTYVTDNKQRVVEKTSKTFVQYRFCPMCGYDYKTGKFLVDGVHRKEPPKIE